MGHDGNFGTAGDPTFIVVRGTDQLLVEALGGGGGSDDDTAGGDGYSGGGGGSITGYPGEEWNINEVKDYETL